VPSFGVISYQLSVSLLALLGRLACGTLRVNVVPHRRGTPTPGAKGFSEVHLLHLITLTDLVIIFNILFISKDNFI